MKWAAELISNFDNTTIDAVLENDYCLNPAAVAEGEAPITINADDLEVYTDHIPGYEVAAKGSLTVALDITISDDLKKEGDAREFVNRIQNIRKESGFNLTDRIAVTIRENEALQPALIQYKAYICAEILADSLAFLPVINDGIEIEVNDVILDVNVLKKGK